MQTTEHLYGNSITVGRRYIPVEGLFSQYFSGSATKNMHMSHYKYNLMLCRISLNFIYRIQKELTANESILCLKSCAGILVVGLKFHSKGWSGRNYGWGTKGVSIVYVYPSSVAIKNLKS